MKIHRYILFVLILGLWSCSTTNKIPRAQKAGLEEVIYQLENQQIDFTHFSAKAKVNFRGKEFNGTGRSNIRMIKDSLLWMNFKKISIEGSRTLMTQDSFWIIYRIDKIYESGTLDELMQAYELDFNLSELQDLLVDRLPLPQEGTEVDFITERLHIISFDDLDRHITYHIDGDFYIRKIRIVDNKSRVINATFDDYNTEGIALKKEFNVDLGNGDQAQIKIQLSNIEIDIPKTIRFEVPDHYVRLP